MVSFIHRLFRFYCITLLMKEENNCLLKYDPLDSKYIVF